MKSQDNEFIPDDVMDDATRFVIAAEEEGFEYDPIWLFARATMIERDKCAKAAEGTSAFFDFAAASAAHRDWECGFNTGLQHAAKAIRNQSKPK